MDYDAAVALWMLAALQNYDRVQGDLGSMFHDAENSEEALRWFKLAAAQGQGRALCMVGVFYENDYGVVADQAEAVRWYKHAAAAGWSDSVEALKLLGV